MQVYVPGKRPCVGPGAKYQWKTSPVCRPMLMGGESGIETGVPGKMPSMGPGAKNMWDAQQAHRLLWKDV